MRSLSHRIIRGMKTPAQIIADITRGVEGKRYRIIEDRREAIFESIRTARAR